MGNKFYAEIIALTLFILSTLTQANSSVAAQKNRIDGSYAELTNLFEAWRNFEKPALRNGAPDYTTAVMARKQTELKGYKVRLAAIDTSGWPIEQQVDYHIVRAEMNGLDFNIRVLKPWERDPAFYTSVWSYQSDTPAHEGPTHHALV
ncbi:hypothetical protein MJD09_04460, partial [bacterium]|nr:hypothetical protein [bacterium]